MFLKRNFWSSTDISELKFSFFLIFFKISSNKSSFPSELSNSLKYFGALKSSKIKIPDSLNI